MLDALHLSLDLPLIVAVLAATLRMATPLILAALGELVCEKSGVINLGVEGAMLAGCFTGFVVTFETQSLWLGLAAAVAAGALASLLMGFLAITLRLEQFVSGLAINLLCSGLTTYAFRAMLKLPGHQNMRIPTLGTLAIPGLADLPVIGEVLFRQSVLTYVAIAVVPLLAFWFAHSRAGLQLRCLGENPKMVALRGLRVLTPRYLAVLFGGAMAGLGGAFLSIGTSTQYVEEMTAGRGWLAIVIVVAANWNPVRALYVSLAFALLQALQVQLQANGTQFPYEILLALPYVLALLALVGLRARSHLPAALGTPYVRG